VSAEAIVDVRVASAKAAGTRARVAVASSELQELTLRADREHKLVEAGLYPSGSADDLIARIASVKQGVLAAQAEADAADAQVKALDSRTRELRTRLKDMSIFSPISGTIVGRPPQPGEYMDPQFNGGLRIADLSQLFVEVDVPEAKLGSIKADGPVEILLDAFPDKRFRGEVKEVLPEVDRGKATVSVRVAFLDDNTGVLPEMAARVSFLTHAEDPTAIHELPKKMLPSSAIAERGASKVIFVVETSKVRMVKVKLGPKAGTSFELIEGPPAGTVLVADPPPTLNDGGRVKVNQ